MRNNVLVVAGEESGDLHAGNLIPELKKLVPQQQCSFFGVGGERCLEAGMELVRHSSTLSKMGIAEVLGALPEMLRLLKELEALAASRSVSLAILVDSPDFNLRLAKKLKRAGIPVVLLVAPQVWAWRRGRVKTVAQVADLILCILPFEADFYIEHGARAVYIGHPLVDDLAKQGLVHKKENKEQGLLALLPGSRNMEVKRLLPEMLAAARHAMAEGLVKRAWIYCAPGVSQVVGKLARGEFPILEGADGRVELSKSEFAWTASGTATLECALLGTKMVVGYRLHPITYLLAKMMVKVDSIVLANLVGGRSVVPELIQRAWTREALVEWTRRLKGEEGEEQLKFLETVKKKLGPPGASQRAAEAIAKLMGWVRAGG